MKIKKKDLKALIETFLFEEESDEKKETPKEVLEKDFREIENLSPVEAYQRYFELSENPEFKNIPHKLPQKVRDYFLDILKINEDKIPDADEETTFGKIATNMAATIIKAQGNITGVV